MTNKKDLKNEIRKIKIREIKWRKWDINDRRKEKEMKILMTQKVRIMKYYKETL